MSGNNYKHYENLLKYFSFHFSIGSFHMVQLLHSSHRVDCSARGKSLSDSSARVKSIQLKSIHTPAVTSKARLDFRLVVQIYSDLVKRARKIHRSSVTGNFHNDQSESAGSGLSYKWSQIQWDELQQDVYAAFSCHIVLIQAHVCF